VTSRGYDPRTEQLLDLLKGAGINEREQAYLAVALADQEGLPRAKQDQLALDLGLQIERPEVDRAPARIDAASGDPEAALGSSTFSMRSRRPGASRTIAEVSLPAPSQG